MVMVRSRKMSTYPCKIIPNAIIESAEQLSTDSIIKSFLYLQIEAELSEITGIIWRVNLPAEWTRFFLFFSVGIMLSRCCCVLFGLFTSNHPACQPAVSQWNVLESLWSEASVSTLHPLSLHLTALRVAQAEDGTANKEARESVYGYVCLCVTECVGRLKYSHLSGHFKPAGTSDCSCFACVLCSKC